MVYTNACYRQAGEHMEFPAIAREYAITEENFRKTLGFIESFERVEVYIIDTDAYDIKGVAILTDAEDLHYGNICTVIGIYVSLEYRRGDIFKALVSSINDVASECGYAYWERTKHVNERIRASIITEVKNG